MVYLPKRHVVARIEPIFDPNLPDRTRNQLVQMIDAIPLRQCSGKLLQSWGLWEKRMRPLINGLKLPINQKSHIVSHPLHSNVLTADFTGIRDILGF